MYGIACVLPVFLLVLVGGHPAKDELMFDVGDDTAVVESTVREARAAVPEHIEDLLKPGVKEAFLYTYGDDEHADGDVQGYQKKTQDKKNDGYQHFDSFHKKDGDKYGFEKHSEYGQENKAKVDVGNKKSKKQAKGGSNSEDGEDAETKKSYKVVEDANGNKKRVSAIESYDDGDVGYYGGDSGDSGVYVEEGGEGGEGGDAESESYEESYEEGDGDSGHYEDGDSDSGSYSSAVEYEDDGEADEESDDY